LLRPTKGGSVFFSSALFLQFASVRVANEQSNAGRSNWDGCQIIVQKNEAIFTTILISNIYIPYTDLHKKFGVEGNFRNFECE